jgi:Flp pilus assembly protein TadD
LKIFSTLMVLFLLIGCATDQQDTDEELSSGDAMYRLAENMKRNGDYGTAIRLYRQALAIDPDYKKAQLALADTLMLDGKIDESRSLLDKMLLKEPQNDDLLRELGKIAVAQNDSKTCLETYSTLKKKYPQDANIFNGLAVCYDLRREHTRAHQMYKQAMTLAPENLNIQSNYGLSLALAGKTHEAIEFLLKIAQRSDTTSNIRHNLAVAYGLAGETDKAKSIFSKDLTEKDLEQNIDVLSSLSIENNQKTTSMTASQSLETSQSSQTVALPSSSALIAEKLSSDSSSKEEISKKEGLSLNKKKAKKLKNKD